METQKSKEQPSMFNFDEEPQPAAAPAPPPTYSFDEANRASIDYFGGDEMAAKVWVSKYALKDSFGNIYERTPDDMHWRIAREIARVEAKYANPLTAEQIHEVLANFRYIVPQGGPMTGIGNQYQIASLSNCFVIGESGNADSYGAIMKVDEEQVQLMKRRGGVGHDLSHIRPTGSPVLNSALTSTGIVPFMERFSNSTREVAQDGRRGALMLSISIKHPDSESFIDAKMTAGKVTGANVSVKIDDEFMRCAKEGKPYVQQYPIDAANPKYHGNRPSPACCSGTPYCASRCPTATPIWATAPYRPTPAAKFRSAPTTRAACWPSTSTATWRTPSRRKPDSTSTSSASTYTLRNA